MSQEASFRIYGRVVDTETGEGIHGLLVEGWDADLIFDDLVGSSMTDAAGSFFMEFSENYFTELFFDRRPDLYFQVHQRGRRVHTTKGEIEWNLDVGETWLVIELDRSVLDQESEVARPTHPDPRQSPRVPFDAPAHPGYPVAPPESGAWSEPIARWWSERPQGAAADASLRPWLACDSHLMPQITALTLNQPGTVTVTVANRGTAPSWTCYVEVFEGPPGYEHAPDEYELRGRTLLSLGPGRIRQVAVPWVRRMRVARAVAVVFDPLHDPKDFTVLEQHNRHITSVHYAL